MPNIKFRFTSKFQNYHDQGRRNSFLSSYTSVIMILISKRQSIFLYTRKSKKEPLALTIESVSMSIFGLYQTCEIIST